MNHSSVLAVDNNDGRQQLRAFRGVKLKNKRFHGFPYGKILLCSVKHCNTLCTLLCVQHYTGIMYRVTVQHI